MKSKLINEDLKTYVLVFESGEEVMEGITHFVAENEILAARVTGIGAFSHAELGYFDFSIKDYRNIPVNEQVEVLSLMGDIVQYENKPKLHAHVVIGKADGTAHGGHLLKAFVSPTLEVILTDLPGYLHREMDKETGIPLIKL